MISLYGVATIILSILSLKLCTLRIKKYIVVFDETYPVHVLTSSIYVITKPQKQSSPRPIIAIVLKCIGAFIID